MPALWVLERSGTTSGQNNRLAEGLTAQPCVVGCVNMARHATAAHDKQKLARVRMAGEKTMTQSSRGSRRPMTVEFCVNRTDREIGTTSAG